MTSKTNQYYHDLDQKHYLQTFKRYPITLERGEGAIVWDVEGNKYIDALGGIAVNLLGHNHPALVKAIQEQAARLIHISNFYLSVPQVELSEKLTTLSGLERVFFSNSGAESVEGAIKIARKYAHSKGRGGEVISFEGSFHGRTLATIATGKPQMQKGFEPIPPGFHQIPAGDMKKLRETASNQTAAVIIEPIQGEGGINLADPEFLQSVREFCDQNDIVLIFDEIQCGIARTGKMFAWEHYSVKPDIMTLAKGLGGGVPVGAILSSQKVSDAIDFGDHGTTFGGNPLSTAAALATLKAVEQEELVRKSHEKGQWLTEKIQALNENRIKEIRGKGLMIGIEFDFETKPLVQKMLEHGVLANATAGNVLRLVPPLVISYDEMESVVEVMKLSLKEMNHD
ncbi:MAG: aspartate aminotransferase family protein [Bacteroidales bacterium]